MSLLLVATIKQFLNMLNELFNLTDVSKGKNFLKQSDSNIQDLQDKTYMAAFFNSITPILDHLFL